MQGVLYQAEVWNVNVRFQSREAKSSNYCSLVYLLLLAHGIINRALVVLFIEGGSCAAYNKLRSDCFPERPEQCSHSR